MPDGTRIVSPGLLAGHSPAVWPEAAPAATAAVASRRLQRPSVGSVTSTVVVTEILELAWATGMTTNRPRMPTNSKHNAPMMIDLDGMAPPVESETAPASPASRLFGTELLVFV